MASDCSFGSYLVELRNVAVNVGSLNPDTLDRLKNAGILVGTRRIRKQRSEAAADIIDDQEEWDLVYRLLTPNEVAIADDMITLQQFGEAVFCAPQEDILESEC